MTALRLVIGNKAYSSWSLRPWLALRQTGAAFDEEVIPLRQDTTRPAIRAHSGAGKVPVLIDGPVTVWESLAICEYLAERFPDAGLWPAAAGERALARSAATEMHGGFVELRRALPMDLKRAPEPRALAEPAEADVARLTSLWRQLLARPRAGGPFLFGRFTIADAMYAPVCTRFQTHQIALDPVSQAYVEAVLGLPAFADWRTAALAEPWVLAY